MSWVRWGSPCDQPWPWRMSLCSAAPKPCPGSDVYVWEDVNGKFACGCGNETPVYLDTREEMRAHLAEHAANGYHVPMRLYDDGAMAEATERFDAETRRVFGDQAGSSGGGKSDGGNG